jgi:hypothetical protein
MTVLILIFWKLLYNREEAAETFGISLRKIDELVAEGKLKPRRIDNSVRFYVGELVRFASLNPVDLKGGDNAVEDNDDHAA